jgi:peptidoglycan/LPS O-acetylase OafA/YrhL
MSQGATETRGHQRIEALDTLRFFAALAVVLEHSHSVFPAFRLCRRHSADCSALTRLWRCSSC